MTSPRRDRRHNQPTDIALLWESGRVRWDEHDQLIADIKEDQS